MQRHLVVNGRFLTQGLTGVQRYAAEMVMALDTIAGSGDAAARGFTLELYAPRHVAPPPQLRVIGLREVGRLHGHPWEQVDLCRSAHSAVLVNLCSSAPLTHPRQIVTIHDASVLAFPDNFAPLYRRWYRLLYRGLARRATHIVTVSHFSAAELSRLLQVPASRLHVIPNAADHFDRIEARPGTLDRLGLRAGGYVIAVGSRSKLKNLGIIDAVARLVNDPTLKFVVAGRRNGKVFGDGEPARHEPARVTELGPVGDDELKSLYQHALCLVFPSLYEGFGLPPLEAMRCGCPVVASNAAALPEICADAALYCDPSDESTIARQIDRLRADPERRRDLVQRGLARAKSYSWKQSALALLDLCADLVAA